MVVLNQAKEPKTKKDLNKGKLSTPLVIQISQKEFNVEMDSYIHKVKKQETTEKKEKKKEPKKDAELKEFKEEEKEYYSKKKPFFDRIMDFIAGSEESMEESTEEGREESTEQGEKTALSKEEKEEEKELEQCSEKAEKKEGFFSSVKGWLSSGEKPKKEEKSREEKPPALEEDVKQVLKIQNKWLLKLPVKTIKEFKDSEDYKLYRETLKKYNLIRIKE